MAVSEAGHATESWDSGRKRNADYGTPRQPQPRWALSTGRQEADGIQPGWRKGSAAVGGRPGESCCTTITL